LGEITYLFLKKTNGSEAKTWALKNGVRRATLGSEESRKETTTATKGQKHAINPFQ